MTVVGVVTGLRAEARLARDAGLRAFASGAAPGRATALAARLVADGATLLVSLGLAGGLDPGLAPGVLIVPDRVIDGPHHSPVDAPAALRLRAALPDALDLDVLGADRPLASVAAKAAARQATGAGAVDTESHSVARAARAAGVGFIVVRAIADGAAQALPSAALVALGPDGRVAVHRVIGAAIARPGQIPDLARLGLASRRAFAALRRAAAALAALQEG